MYTYNFYLIDIFNTYKLKKKIAKKERKKKERKKDFLTIFNIIYTNVE